MGEKYSFIDLDDVLNSIAGFGNTDAGFRILEFYGFVV